MTPDKGATRTVAFLIMQINTTRHKAVHVATEARMGGSPVSDFHGNCTDPVFMNMFGYPDAVLVSLGIEPDRNVSQHLYVRCRRCEACLAHRGRVWTARAVSETLASHRTWFGTLTLHPDRATQARYAADRALAAAISDRGDTTNQFRAMVDFVNPEITRMLKRIRKNSGAGLRYLLVAEAHKSGMPHWHILLHEHSVACPKRILDQAWQYGFCKWKLVETQEPRQARYVCKYLSKAALSRVRASAYYGSAVPDLITERILNATRATRAAIAAKLDADNPPPIQGEGTHL